MPNLPISSGSGSHSHASPSTSRQYRFPWRAALLVTLGCAALGCSDTHSDFGRPRTLLQTAVALGQHLMLVDQESATAYLIDVNNLTTSPVRVPLAQAPLLAMPRRGDRHEALVLSLGKSGGQDEAQSPAALTVLAPDGIVRQFGLGNNPFDSVEQSHEGDFAALRRLGNGDRLLKNINQMAFINLDAAPEDDDALRFLALREAPRHVFFSENFELSGKPRQLAVVLTANAVAVVDLQDTQAQPALVGLNSGNANPLLPHQVLFDSNSERIYILSSNADDVFALRLTERAPEAEKVDFDLSVDIIAAGQDPSDMRAFTLDNKNYLAITARGSRALIVVDVETSRTASLGLPQRYDRLFVFNRGGPTSPVPHALLWESSGRKLASVALVPNLSALEQTIESLPDLPSQATEAIDLQQGDFAFVGKKSGLTMVRPDANQVVPFVTPVSLGDGILDNERQQLWVAPAHQKRVAYLDLASGATDELVLDAPIFMASLVSEAGRLVIVHDDALGYLTVIDVTDPDRNSTQSTRGFLLTDILEEETSR